MPTTPPTFVDATELPASDLNLLRDAILELQLTAESLTASAVKLNRTSAQSIPDDTWTAVTWNNELGDLGGYWSSGTDIVMPSDFAAGVTAHLVRGSVVAVFASNGTGARGIRTVLDGGVVESYTFDASTSGATTCVLPFSHFGVEEAGVMTFEVYQNSSGALNLNGCIVTIERGAPSA